MALNIAENGYIRKKIQYYQGFENLMPSKTNDLIPADRIFKIIYIIRNEKVILDSDMAALYGVETRRLNEQVRRNMDKFPEDFMFQLTKEEFDNLKSQIATSSSGSIRYVLNF
ncbi:MAG: ORF6N domain-containing protein [Pseudomonadota bacterium]